MPNYSAILRPSSLAAAARSKIRSTRKALSKFARPQSFSPPQTFSAVAPRVSRNLSLFRIHYALLLWICLLVSLAPSHKPTMIFLMAASKVALFYEVVVRAVPSSWRFVHRLLDRRVAVAFFLGVLLVELTATGAMRELGVAMVVGIPMVLLHSVLYRAGDDGFGPDLDEGEGEEKKADADLEDPGSAR